MRSEGLSAGALVAYASALLMLVLAGCGVSPADSSSSGGPHEGPAGASVIDVTRDVPTRPAPTQAPAGSAGEPTTGRPQSALAPPTVAGVEWKAMGRKVRGQRAVWVAQTASGSVGMMWMNPDLLTFRYIPGYKFPEGSPARPVDNRPATWTSRMVAAFNGGFQLKDGVGGYYYADRTVRPLKDGRASLIVASDGRLHVTVWSSGNRVPRGTLAIRQNLPPLVVAGRSRAKDGDSPAAWGNADHGNPRANRSALGELADGSLVFAYGSEVPAAAMGDALASVGARTAIMLDMNKSWPMGFVYDAPKGGHSPAGHRIQPRIWRDASSYVSRFSKDFVVALAPGGRKK